MNRPMMKWAPLSCIAVALSVFSLHAGSQQTPRAFQDIAPVPDLHTNTPIAMSTNHSKGRESLSTTASPFTASATANAAATHSGPRYPGDLQYNGGPTIPFASHHSIFVNPSAQCPPNTCWGDPVGFLSNLGRSEFIHVADQYTGEDASNRYAGGANYFIPGYTPSAGAGKPFTNLDLAIAAYSLAAATSGFGFNHIYHLFLVPGQDVCFDSTLRTCYSPDNGNTFAFCAYHGSASDSAGNLVLYTVEPYQDVSGCSVRPGTPNGQLTDSTNNVLSNETFETITDPRGNAWWNVLDNGLFGEEIGDECAFLAFTATDVFFDPSIVRLNHKLYATQPEYNNERHACTTSTGDWKGPKS